MSSKVVLYTAKACPDCRLVKQLLDRENVSYEERDLATPGALTELAMDGVYALQAPVLRIGSRYYMHINGKIDQILKENF